MLTKGPQRAWLALAGDSVAGFAIAFPVRGLSGLRWEIDLLAVLPLWRGLGLATRLVRAAAAYGAGLADRARAWVAADNRASARVFTRVGFRTEPEMCTLLVYRLEGLEAHSWSAPGVTVREATSAVEVQSWLPGLSPDGKHADLTLLFAEQDGRPAGHAELLKVQTLLYGGVWIESLEARVPLVREMLVHQVVDYAMAAGLDEIGAMVPKRNWAVRDSLLARGFRLLGDYQCLLADLPLPGRAALQHRISGEGNEHV